MAVIAYHLIWTNYGTWLPNDPRGSGSREVYTPVLAELGELHFGRRLVQPRRGAVREFYQHAKPRLQFPALRWDLPQIDVIADSIAAVVQEQVYTCYACAIMLDHVHLVIRKHKHDAETMIDHFQSTSCSRLRLQRNVPGEHPTWAKSGWRVFLDNPTAVRQRVRYVERNPEREGLPRQYWRFVTPYDDWPFHKRRS